MPVFLPILAGLGALAGCMSNPPRRRRAKPRRRNPNALNKRWAPASGWAILKRGQRTSGVLYSSREQAEQQLGFLRKGITGGSYRTARIVKVNPGKRRNPLMKRDIKVGTRIHTGLHSGLSSNKNGTIVTYADAERGGLDGYSLGLIRRSGWVPIRLDDGSFTSLSPVMLTRRNPHRRNPSADDVRELVLFITNDGDLYRQQTQPILKNLAKKIKKGVYDHAKAVKLWGYLADNGAQRYTKESGSGGSTSYGIFSKSIRMIAAKELQDYYQEDLDDTVKSNPRRRRSKRSRR